MVVVVDISGGSSRECQSRNGNAKHGAGGGGSRSPGSTGGRGCGEGYTRWNSSSLSVGRGRTANGSQKVRMAVGQPHKRSPPIGPIHLSDGGLPLTDHGISGFQGFH